MKALTWHGCRDVLITQQPDPRIQDLTDAVIRVSSTAICGSYLHLYELLGPNLAEGDILGHEAMGTVEETGSDVSNLRAGDRVAVPFNVSCCPRAEHGLGELLGGLAADSKAWGSGGIGEISALR